MKIYVIKLEEVSWKENSWRKTYRFSIHSFLRAFLLFLDLLLDPVVRWPTGSSKVEGTNCIGSLTGRDEASGFVDLNSGRKWEVVGQTSEIAPHTTPLSKIASLTSLSSLTVIATCSTVFSGMDSGWIWEKCEFLTFCNVAWNLTLDAMISARVFCDLGFFASPTKLLLLFKKESTLTRHQIFWNNSEVFVYNN